MQVLLRFPMLSWHDGTSDNSTAGFAYDNNFDLARVYHDAVTAGGLYDEDHTYDHGLNTTNGLRLRYFEGELACGDGVCSRDEVWAHDDETGTSCEADCGPILYACTPPALHDIPWPTQPRPLVEARNSIFTLTKPPRTPMVCGIFLQCPCRHNLLLLGEIVCFLRDAHYLVACTVCPPCHKSMPKLARLA
jgi:hypothetical protein